MDIKYPPNTLQIFSQCFTGSWSTEKLLMFFLLSFFNCISVFIQIEYFHKDRGQQNTNQLHKSFELEILNFLMPCHVKNGCSLLMTLFILAHFTMLSVLFWM